MESFITCNAQMSEDFSSAKGLTRQTAETEASSSVGSELRHRERPIRFPPANERKAEKHCNVHYLHDSRVY
jgi:hypothetical protein